MKKINKAALIFGTVELGVAVGPLVVLYMQIPNLYAITGINVGLVSIVCMGLAVTVFGLWAARSIFKDLHKIW